jgi:hypothetical protein
MAKTRSHRAEVAERIDWLLSEASNQHNGTGGEREHVIISALLDAARAQAKELARS